MPPPGADYLSIQGSPLIDKFPKEIRISVYEALFEGSEYALGDESRYSTTAILGVSQLVRVEAMPVFIDRVSVVTAIANEIVHHGPLCIDIGLKLPPLIHGSQIKSLVMRTKCYERAVRCADIVRALPSLLHISLVDTFPIILNSGNLHSIDIESIRAVNTKTGNQISEMLEKAIWWPRKERHQNLLTLFRFQSICGSIRTLSVEQRFVFEAEDEKPAFDVMFVARITPECGVFEAQIGGQTFERDMEARNFAMLYQTVREDAWTLDPAGANGRTAEEDVVTAMARLLSLLDRIRVLEAMGAQ